MNQIFLNFIDVVESVLKNRKTSFLGTTLDDNENRHDIYVEQSITQLHITCDDMLASLLEIIKCLYANDFTSELHTRDFIGLDTMYCIDYDDATPKYYSVKYLKAQIDVLFHYFKYLDSNIIWEDWKVYDDFYLALYDDIIEYYELSNVTYKYRFVKRIYKAYKISKFKPIKKLI